MGAWQQVHCGDLLQAGFVVHMGEHTEYYSVDVVCHSAILPFCHLFLVREQAHRKPTVVQWKMSVKSTFLPVSAAEFGFSMLETGPLLSPLCLLSPLLPGPLDDPEGNPSHSAACFPLDPRPARAHVSL